MSENNKYLSPTEKALQRFMIHIFWKMQNVFFVRALWKFGGAKYMMSLDNFDGGTHTHRLPYDPRLWQVRPCSRENIDRSSICSQKCQSRTYLHYSSRLRDNTGRHYFHSLHQFIRPLLLHIQEWITYVLSLVGLSVMSAWADSMWLSRPVAFIVWVSIFRYYNFSFNGGHILNKTRKTRLTERRVKMFGNVEYWVKEHTSFPIFKINNRVRACHFHVSLS